MNVPKTIALLVLLTLSILFTTRYFSSENLSGDIPEPQQPEPKPPTEANPGLNLFTDSIICKAITNAIIGVRLAIMKANVLPETVIISFKDEAEGKNLSYNCKRLDNRFYWESSSKFLSQSIIEVEATVVESRTDELSLSIYDTSDTGNIVKTYSIDQFE